MSEILDEVDIGLLRRCSQNPGSALAEIFGPFLGELSSRTLYDRLFELEVRQFISVDRTARRGRALATLTERGKRAITGREKPAPSKEARSP